MEPHERAVRTGSLLQFFRGYEFAVALDWGGHWAVGLFPQEDYCFLGVQPSRPNIELKAGEANADQDVWFHSTRRQGGQSLPLLSARTKNCFGVRGFSNPKHSSVNFGPQKSCWLRRNPDIPIYRQAKAGVTEGRLTAAKQRRSSSLQDDKLGLPKIQVLLPTVGYLLDGP